MGWEDLWKDPKVRERWEAMPPIQEVVDMADRLEAEGGRRVLDIGCGLGRHTVYLAARGFEVTATDNAPAALAACKANLEEAGLTANVVETEMTDYPFPDGHFAGALGSHVIHHTVCLELRQDLVQLFIAGLGASAVFASERWPPLHDNGALCKGVLGLRDHVAHHHVEKRRVHDGGLDHHPDGRMRLRPVVLGPLFGLGWFHLHHVLSAGFRRFGLVL